MGQIISDNIGFILILTGSFILISITIYDYVSKIEKRFSMLFHLSRIANGYKIEYHTGAVQAIDPQKHEVEEKVWQEYYRTYEEMQKLFPNEKIQDLEDLVKDFYKIRRIKKDAV
jgi:hypothetical protein